MPPKRSPASGSAALHPDDAERRSHPPSDFDDLGDQGASEVTAEEFRRLQTELAATLARLVTLEQQRAAPPAPAPPPAGPPASDPKVPTPPEFSGKVSDFRNFIAHCTLTFTMCPNTYRTDEQKVLFVISLLRGTAFSWAREIPEQDDHPLRNNYPAFKQALSNLYMDRNLRATSEAKLSQLRQTKSAAAYAVDFQSLSDPLDLNDSAKCLLFYDKLKPEVKDAIATVGRAPTFAALVDQAVSIDQRKHQRSMEEKKSPASSSPSYSKPPSTSASANAAFSQSSSSSTSSSKPHGPLSDSEKTRRKQKGLCMYCADPGHVWANCPRRLALADKANALPIAPPYAPPANPTITLLSGNSNPQAPPRSEA